MSDSLPTEDDEYGEREYYERQAPNREIRFGCEGMTTNEFESLGVAMSAHGVLVSVQDHQGRTWTGKFTSLTSKPIPGCDYHEDIQLVLEG